MANTKNKFGQYFTPEQVADFMVDLTTIKKNGKVLEPCAGHGVFLKQLAEKGYANIQAYEIDQSLSNSLFPYVKFKSFISEPIDEKFDLIIGNPPYIRWKHLEESLKDELEANILWNKYFNSLCDYLYIFILKSIELLRENGELIFICPEYWLNTTHSLSLRNYMMSHGYFESIFHFNETPIFNKVTVSIIIFKYIKSKTHTRKKILLAKYYSSQKLTPEFLNTLKVMGTYNDLEWSEIEQFGVGQRWLLASDKVRNELRHFEKKCAVIKDQAGSLFETPLSYHTIGEMCDIGNGLVSGLDKAFQLNGHSLNSLEKQAILPVIKAKDLSQFHHYEITKYIFIREKLTEENVMKKYPVFYDHLMEWKDQLCLRYNYNREIKFWEWVFLRNYNLFSRSEPRIFVPCKERISNKRHFRFAYVESGIYPTQDVTAIFKKKGVDESIYYILAMLNNHRTFKWLCHNGIVKGNIVEFSEKPITSIPIKRINWNDNNEVNLHNTITQYCKEYVETKNKRSYEKMEAAIDTYLT